MTISRNDNIEKSPRVFNEAKKAKQVADEKQSRYASLVDSYENLPSTTGLEGLANLADQSFRKQTTSTSSFSIDNYSRIKTRHTFIPSWRDYAGSSDKLRNDNLESQIAFASICKTNTTYPYGCNSYHSQIAQNYNLSVSPNVQGLKQYQRTNSYTYFTYQTLKTTQTSTLSTPTPNNAGPSTSTPITKTPPTLSPRSTIKASSSTKPLILSGIL